MLCDALAHLDKAWRHHLRMGGITIGSLYIFHPALLKPGAAQWRLALLAARHDKPMAQSPAPGAALFTPKGEAAETGARISGFRSFAGQFMRMDIAERLVRDRKSARLNSSQ